MTLIFTLFIITDKLLCKTSKACCPILQLKTNPTQCFDITNIPIYETLYIMKNNLIDRRKKQQQQQTIPELVKLLRI